MSCFHPCFIQKIYNPLNLDEFDTKFISSKVALTIKECRDIIDEKFTGNKQIGTIFRSSYGGRPCEFVMIPCGKCIGCRIDYKRSWADRLTYHSLGNQENSYFLTLTYDDDNMEHLYHNELYDIHSINFQDVTDFLKALRNHFRGVNIDYYYSMEYGDSNFRCHAHLILFNVPFDDLEFFKLDDLGAPVYVSPLVDKLWQKGIHQLSKFSWLNAAYTAGYVQKKLDGRRSDEYLALGLTPEGCRMSRRPGIAFDFYRKNHSNIWLNNGLDVDRSVNSSGHLGIPRYFRKLACDGYTDPDTKEFIQHLDEFSLWQQRTNDLSNIINPIKLDNSSFDLERVDKLLQFEEREILSRQISRKL